MFQLLSAGWLSTPPCPIQSREQGLPGGRPIARGQHRSLNEGGTVHAVVAHLETHVSRVLGQVLEQLDRAAHGLFGRPFGPTSPAEAFLQPRQQHLVLTGTSRAHTSSAPIGAQVGSPWWRCAVVPLLRMLVKERILCRTFVAGCPRNCNEMCGKRTPNGSGLGSTRRRTTGSTDTEAKKKPTSLVQFLLGQEGLQQKGRVLDAGCGAGRHARAFFQRGWHVHAFDLSEASISAAEIIRLSRPTRSSIIKSET